MTLRELIERARLEPQLGPGPEEGSELSEQELATAVTGLAYRSDELAPGALFFCVRGFKADGHDFAPSAVERGACALVCERPLGLGVPELLVADARKAMAPIAAAFHDDPTASLEVVGVTGTNGKTTTAFLLRDVFEAAGRQTGLLGTVKSVIGGEVEEVVRTTPEAIDLQQSFRRMLDGGDAACVMEVSSHALELHRAAAIHFDCAVFTNLTQDHLDFHGTLEEYFGAKRRLFAPQASPVPRLPVVNVDDEWGRRLVEEIVEAGHADVVTFAIDREADYRASDVEFDASGTRFTCVSAQGSTRVSVPLPGRFNVNNALAALAASCSLGVDPEAAAAGLARAGQVPGRLESIDEGQAFTVLVDYAHTPDSLANVLRAGRELLEQAAAGGRLVCVFGAGGDRDRDKRPLMGEAARSFADRVIVTSDNPRSEDPEAIIAAILAGAQAVREARSELEVEPDRAAAIELAVGAAGDHDVVLIAGKGHEQGQELAGGKKIPFDDREVARRALRALGASRARPAA
jgi:UDP-N-acetylmuramoyl-L-alanyl-D-glutamate--2,6-diaminopimelate ligase